MPFFSGNPILFNSEFLLWIVNVECYQNDWKYYYGILNKQERERVHKIAVDKARKKKIIQRGILKCILADKLNIKPEDVHILKDKTGKPYIYDTYLSFNYSHSREFFLIGIARKKNIGVDIQVSKQLKYSYPAIILSDKEKAYLKSLGEKDKSRFYWRTWTIKEAFSKATGKGMTSDFSHIEVSWDETKERCIGILDDNQKSVQAGSFAETEYYYAYVLLD